MPTCGSICITRANRHRKGLGMDTYWAWEYGTGDKKNVIELVRAADAQRALDAEREKVKRLSTCGTDHSTPWWQVKCEDLEAQLATLQAQLADRDAMILQMGEQAAVLAKENMAVKAQLRQVEGERNIARRRVDELESREIDVEILKGDLATPRQWLRQLIKGMKTAKGMHD